MLNKIIENKTKIHTRDIQLATYPHTDGQVIVHGVLKDQRYTKVFDITGEVKEPGIVHHLDVKLLIKPDPLMIEDVQVQMVHVPLSECTDTLDTVEKLKGLEIKSGFSKSIRDIMGGKKGCSHLCNLIIVMGQEIVQGWLAHDRRKKPLIPKDLDSIREKNFLIDSCRMWTLQGPKVKSLKKAIESNQ
ncbi:DUF2889 domain-containing protein [Desulfobacula toluolica]|uniref:Conserved uncharacterized protein n=1 Tax=Desulfobacula toluolica (strain DSM 7467 / Tol2) TaxID=651182 RepID=K0NQ54_DESTT|nr:DUF2889 domain-containing protein [Desulfobacula toluolica]CCK81002.1 conserved uncharacterized protein [Desulfobacula toluolica Tol2]